MPDLSPSLTLLLQLPHLDEEVEALVITTGNYLISLSQQLGYLAKGAKRQSHTTNMLTSLDICYLINFTNPFGRLFCRPCDRRHIVAQMAGDEMSLTRSR